jgi:hypothetical protein
MNTNETMVFFYGLFMDESLLGSKGVYPTKSTIGYVDIVGVVSACNRDDRPHLITVTYDTERVKSHDILVGLKNEGIHAELVGL